MATRSTSRSGRSRSTSRPVIDDVDDAELDEELARLSEWPEEASPSEDTSTDATTADDTETASVDVDEASDVDITADGDSVDARAAADTDDVEARADEGDDDDEADPDATRPMERALSLLKRGRSSIGWGRRSGGTEQQLARGPISGALRYVLNRYELAESAPLPQSIAVISSLRGEGVSTISRSLAEVLVTDFSARVCWIDLSWTGQHRRRRDPEPAEVPPGMYEVVCGTASLDDVLVRHGDTNLYSLRVGAVPDHQRSAMVRWAELRELIEEVRAEFDHLVLDMAPVLADPDALALMRFADAQILVAGHAAVSASQIQTVMKDLGTIPLLGAVLNRYSTNTPRFIRRFFAG